MSKQLELPKTESGILTVSKSDVPSNDGSPFTYKVVVYNQQIYAVGYQHERLQWATDYFNWKIAGGTYENLYENAAFDLKSDKKTLTLHFNHIPLQTTMSPTDAYTDYMTHAKIIPESEVYSTHLELLKAKLIQAMLNTPTKSEVDTREKAHADIIKDQIEKTLHLISPSLYTAASKAKQTLIVAFEMDEHILTKNRRYPRYTKFPCADGKVRESFDDYVYYVCEQIFERHTDDSDSKTWIGVRLMERIRSLFPHLIVTCGGGTSVFPEILIHMNIDVSTVEKNL